MNKPLISVNLTTYNRAKLLQRALDSILAQNYPNLEIIIVDDYSGDNTKDVVKSYMDRDSRVKYLRHEKNMGNAKARNTALTNSSGHFIAFMDDDDEWIDKDKISKQVEILSNSKNIGIVCSNIRYYENEKEYEDSDIGIPKDLKAHILKGNGIIHNSTVMTRKTLMEKVGGFDEKMLRGVDSEFFRRCIVKYKIKVHFMPDITTAYRGFGKDRMTALEKRKDIRKALNANVYITKKYFQYYLIRPLVLTKRLKKIVLLTIKYLQFYRYG